MKSTLISHSSIIVETQDANIWCDPWLISRVFNDSWQLLPEASFDNSWYDKIDYIWISHEHPDHFNIPTLKSLPEDFKKRVTILFQKNNSDKIPKAFKVLGFEKIILLDNRITFPLTSLTKIYCYQVGVMDSALVISDATGTLLNVNDCEVNTNDLKVVKKDIGRVDIIFNQFSLAGYDGRYEGRDKRLKEMANCKLVNMVDTHKFFNAKFTVPFASLIYFCREDNDYINHYANTPSDVYDYFSNSGLDCRVIFPGESIDLDGEHDTKKSLMQYDELFNDKSNYTLESAEKVELPVIISAFEKRYQQLLDCYPVFILNALKPLIVKIPDLNTSIEFSFAEGSVKEVSDVKEDAIIYSQPLWLTFAQKFGLQTLAISGRWEVRQNYSLWKRYRILLSLNNAEVYLKLKYLFSTENISWFKSRLGGGLNQVFYKLKRMK